MATVYFSLLLICGILSEGIGILSEGNIEKSSNLLIRKKRVINLSPMLNVPVEIHDASYMANVLRDGHHICGASILASQILLTAAHCVRILGTYSALTGSSYVNAGTPHEILSKLPHPEFRPPSLENDLAILIIDPPIDYINSPSWPIELYDQVHIPANRWGTLTGWGCNRIFREEMIFPDELRSIMVPTITAEQCHHHYNHTVFTNKHLCTYDIARQRGSCYGDSGGGFVLDGKLAGVMSWSSTHLDDLRPDVYMSLANLGFRTWINGIRRNIDVIVRRARSHMHG